jgi:hypothetical protein
MIEKYGKNSRSEAVQENPPDLCAVIRGIVKADS